MGVEFALDSFYVYYTVQVWKKSNLFLGKESYATFYKSAFGYYLKFPLLILPDLG